MDVEAKSEQEQVAFFDAAHDRFCRAVHAKGRTDVHYRVAGTTVRLSFAGSALIERLAPALEHLRQPEAPDADLTLCLWDSRSTGVEMLPPPCGRNRFTDRGDIWGFDSRRIKTAFHYADYSLNLMDHHTRIGIYWVQDAAQLPYWVDAAPLRTLFHWWVETRGCQMLHAAAVGGPDSGLLITGRGGVGKSTTALACLCAGLDYAADDYLIVALVPEPRIFMLYSTAKLLHADMPRFPQLAHTAAPLRCADQDKRVLFLHPAYSEHLRRELPLTAIAVPRVDRRRLTGFDRRSLQAVVQAASFTTMSHLPGVGRHTYEFVKRLCQRRPGFTLTLGHDRDGVPAAVAGLLRDSPARGRREEPAAIVSGPLDPSPLVSVIIPVYNGARFIPEAVQSILHQRYPAIEIIVVDDGSTDDTARVVQRLPVDIRYVSQVNSGAAAARNRGIRDASGELLAFLDVDDLWPADSLGLRVAEMIEDPGLDVVHGYGQLLSIDPVTQDYEFRGNPAETFPFYIGAALYRRRVFSRIGLFDAALMFGEDTDWFKRANERGAVMKRLDAVTLHVRRHRDNMTRGKTMLELNTLRVFKKALDRRRNR